MTPDPTIDALDQRATKIMLLIQNLADDIRSQIERDLPGSHHALKMTLVDQYELTARSEIKLMANEITEIASARRSRRVAS